MARRPLCLACLLLMLAIAMGRFAGDAPDQGESSAEICFRIFKKASGDHHLRGGGTVRRK